MRSVLMEKQSSSEETNNNYPSLLSVKEAAVFLRLAPQTIYGFTSKRIIPFLKRGKKIYFKHTDLELWLEEGRKKSVRELYNEIALKRR